MKQAEVSAEADICLSRSVEKSSKLVSITYSALVSGNEDIASDQILKGRRGYPGNFSG